MNVFLIKRIVEFLIVEPHILVVHADGNRLIFRIVVIHLVVQKHFPASGGRHAERDVKLVHHLRVGGKSRHFSDFRDGVAGIAQQSQAFGDTHGVDRLNDRFSRVFFELGSDISFMVSDLPRDIVESDFLAEMMLDIQPYLFYIMHVILFEQPDAFGDFHKQQRNIQPNAEPILRIHVVFQKGGNNAAKHGIDVGKVGHDRITRFARRQRFQRGVFNQYSVIDG